MNNNTTLTFSWVENGLQHKRVYDREKIKAIFQGLKDGFEDDNEISTKIVSKLPETVVVFINKDANFNMDIPCVGLTLSRFDENGDPIKEPLFIRRYHKIVWSILDRLCTEDQEDERIREIER